MAHGTTAAFNFERPTIALKIDIDTLRGTREGIPRLLRLLDQENAEASFLFSMGPDNTGRALKRIFKKGFLGKVRRTSVLEHYGLRTLTYGLLGSGPIISQKATAIMRSVLSSGQDIAIHTWDHIAWQDSVSIQTAAWTQQQINWAIESFQTVFKQRPKGFGAAGWQMNNHAFEYLSELGFEWSSDCRGQYPFKPIIRSQVLSCLQIPTTLPTLDELIGVDGATISDSIRNLLTQTESTPQKHHVFTLHAELEGMKFMDHFCELLVNWKKQGYDLISMDRYSKILSKQPIPSGTFIQGQVPGRSGTLCLQETNPSSQPTLLGQQP